MSVNDLISIVVAKLHAKRHNHKYAEPNQDFYAGYACALDDAIEILESYYEGRKNAVERDCPNANNSSRCGSCNICNSSKPF